MKDSKRATTARGNHRRLLATAMMAALSVATIGAVSARGQHTPNTTVSSQAARSGQIMSLQGIRW